MKHKTLVLDTSAFIGGFDPLSFPEKQYTVDEVKNELNQESMIWVRFHTAIENGKIIILQPKEMFSQEVREASKNLGDMRYLSKADMQVLALALELKSEGATPLVITDDYSMQNVANKIEVEFTSLMTFGIKKRFKWILYCPACYHKYPSDYEFNSCEVCGTELKRKPQKKSRLRKTKKNGAGDGI
ncbi:MAG: ribonuclease VapC [Candidatus Bathyarchaeota archaeon]|nr:ribonuclease VapC [Candidatus Bathyarchaeum tardum]WGM89659.1 MAG: ribonuclease VapC [Candidatus Bathyarchaeum tardum]WNZ30240.1 MAG: ribonuclease VapC [Candidatus Bathyarchaeota archaeon]